MCQWTDWRVYKRHDPTCPCVVKNNASWKPFATTLSSSFVVKRVLVKRLRSLNSCMKLDGPILIVVSHFWDDDVIWKANHLPAQTILVWLVLLNLVVWPLSVWQSVLDMSSICRIKKCLIKSVMMLRPLQRPVSSSWLMVCFWENCHKIFSLQSTRCLSLMKLMNATSIRISLLVWSAESLNWEPSLVVRIVRKSRYERMIGKCIDRTCH